ncbi:hypothetical protein Salat_2613600 [Sesamum alatum]|uniref:Uncharacterized protein n=1 Tax=Sesamum alatum TaxID=300844 RepID=A0AAE1XND7_9LAMI|nr:hypothetical protein Salat_2613600 [Sesamum alatum]
MPESCIDLTAEMRRRVAVICVADSPIHRAVVNVRDAAVPNARGIFDQTFCRSREVFQIALMPIVERYFRSPNRHCLQVWVFTRAAAIRISAPITVTFGSNFR